KGEENEHYLGSIFSTVPIEPGTSFTRPSAGGGGVGDPLLRDPHAVCEDVADDYVSVERARIDYGVVIREIDRDLASYDVDHEATKAERELIAGAREGWLEEDPERVAARYRDGELCHLDCFRRYGVILKWGTGELLPSTTKDFRAMLKRSAVPHWSKSPPVDGAPEAIA